MLPLVPNMTTAETVTSLGPPSSRPFGFPHPPAEALERVSPPDRRSPSLRVRSSRNQLAHLAPETGNLSSDDLTLRTEALQALSSSEGHALRPSRLSGVLDARWPGSTS